MYLSQSALCWKRTFNFFQVAVVATGRCWSLSQCRRMQAVQVHAGGAGACRCVQARAGGAGRAPVEKRACRASSWKLQRSLTSEETPPCAFEETLRTNERKASWCFARYTLSVSAAFPGFKVSIQSRIQPFQTLLLKREMFCVSPTSLVNRVNVVVWILKPAEVEPPALNAECTFDTQALLWSSTLSRVVQSWLKSIYKDKYWINIFATNATPNVCVGFSLSLTEWCKPSHRTFKRFIWISHIVWVIFRHMQPLKIWWVLEDLALDGGRPCRLKLLHL